MAICKSLVSVFEAEVAAAWRGESSPDPPMTGGRGRVETRKRVPNLDWEDGVEGTPIAPPEEHPIDASSHSLGRLDELTRSSTSGCGQGVLAPYITAQGARYTGIDASPRHRAFAAMARTDDFSSPTQHGCDRAR